MMEVNKLPKYPWNNFFFNFFRGLGGSAPDYYYTSLIIIIMHYDMHARCFLLFYSQLIKLISFLFILNKAYALNISIVSGKSNKESIYGCEGQFLFRPKCIKAKCISQVKLAFFKSFLFLSVRIFGSITFLSRGYFEICKYRKIDEDC
ncbi:hypothetical protein KFK09_024301 [Dendrobium nobile]|uniref:Transmembrane protein n=1 Tax=Dendrobium nobile TaxID=94219 RepID=A0A8T3ADC9_DENNO|nr:hypothetical protein KFK09_024301 [Dendrobium nobile]